jgi:alkanesulfonate monooxygenase SsuD/methylene tetrahydromethanopterin reductase-like flavin-dependent oxidoreductase (luciferase family)
MPAMTPERQLGFALRDPFAWEPFASIVSQAEALGYRALFLPEITGRDAVTTLGQLAGESQTLRLATGVLPMTSRSPMLTAMGAATVHERSGGRFVLGLGSGPAVPGALERLRGLIVQLRGLFSGEEIEIDGRRFRLTLRTPSPVPIWIAALGPVAVRMAGEVADGVLLNWCTPERVVKARAQLAEGAGDAGRDASDITVAVYVRAAIGGDDEASMAALHAATAEYAGYPAYARQFADMGFGGATTQDLARGICLSGDPARARERLAGFASAGADLPVVYPIAAGPDPAASVLATLQSLAPTAG